MNSQNNEMKEEPFEEFFVPETIFQFTALRNEARQCFMCPEGVQIKNSLIAHISTEHSQKAANNDSSLRCCECLEGIKIQSELINHLLSHFPIKQEVDSIKLDDIYLESSVDELISKQSPISIFKTQTSEQKIIEPEVASENGRETKFQKKSDNLLESLKVKCNFCSKVFKYKQGAKKHWDLEHNPENPFPCPKPLCVSRCKTLKNLHAHIRTHDPPREESLDKLQCSKCLKCFQSPKQLFLHSYTHREKFFCCDKCGLKFNNKEQVKNHILRHFGIFQKRVYLQRIVCDQCSMMVFTHKMKRHKLVHHSDVKPFKCEFPDCRAAFSDSRILSDHQNIHLKLKPYKCEFCSEAFRSGANLRLHRIRHIDPNRHRCKDCQTNFVTKQALLKHLRRHTEDPEIRPFACDYPGCNSAFKQKDHVRNHVRRTHEKTDETFYCEFCTKSYDRKDALGKHLRKSHNIAKRKSRVFPTCT